MIRRLVLLVVVVWAGTAMGQEAMEGGSGPEKVAVIRLRGLVTEGPGITVFSMMEVDSTGLYELLERLRAAGQDEDVAAVVLSMEEASLSWAQADELREAIGRLREHKKVYAYAENLDQMDYVVATACDEIVMTPEGNVFLTGLAGEMFYLKDLLDKIGVQGDIVEVGDYKGGAESLTRSEPSAEQLEQWNRLFDGYYEHLLESIGQGRGMDIDEVGHLVDEGPYSARGAMEAGLIDALSYRKAFLARLEEAHGEIRLAVDYGEEDYMAVETSSPFEMMMVFQELFEPAEEPTGDLVAVVYLDGPIMTGESVESYGGPVIGSRTIRVALARARSDARIKAVVVRVDSPGGSATASDVIYEAIQQTAAEKPLVVSLGSVAASGGYYAAVGGPKIWAEASSLTGSIGVLGGKFVLGGLFDILGVHTYRFARGRHAGMFSATEPFDATERMKLRTMMEETYERFKASVREGRGEALRGDIEELAQGKIYTGRQARALGLVDEIGGLHAAIQEAASEAGLEEYEVLPLPRPKTFLEVLEELLAGEGEGGSLARLMRAEGGQAVVMELLRGMPGGPGQRTLGKVMLLGRLLQEEGAVLMLGVDVRIMP